MGGVSADPAARPCRSESLRTNSRRPRPTSSRFLIVQEPIPDRITGYAPTGKPLVPHFPCAIRYKDNAYSFKATAEVRLWPCLRPKRRSPIMNIPGRANWKSCLPNPVSLRRIFPLAYSPGVAEACRAHCRRSIPGQPLYGTRQSCRRRLQRHGRTRTGQYRPSRRQTRSWKAKASSSRPSPTSTPMTLS